jgi:hypothetical protein
MWRVLDSTQQPTLLRFISCSRTWWQVCFALNSSIIEASRAQDHLKSNAGYQIDSTKSLVGFDDGKGEGEELRAVY